jgi:hypothetical protein
MTQPLIKTDTLTVTGTMDLTKYGGSVVGAGNALHVRPGTSAVFPVDQNVTADANNSSTTNLAAGNTYTFTGTKTSTLGIVGIQVGLFADKNCKVSVQQSPNATPNWDIVDDYFYTASSTDFGITVQVISSYVRVVVTTNLETTTVFRLSTALCPMVEAVPRSLDKNGNFKISAPTDAYGFKAEHTPMGEIRTVTPARLIGTNFEGTTIDAKFWTTNATGTAATIAQANAQLLLTSGTSSGAAVTMYSVRRSRYVSGVGVRYRAVIQASAGIANNKRRWGIGYGASLPTITDGAWFQFDGTEFAIVTCKGTTEAKVTSFNGQLGATYTPGTSVKTFEIYWTNSKVYFVIGDVVLHMISASTATWANTMNFHIFADSLNADTIAASETLAIRVASIHRLGLMETQPIYYHITGAAATHTLKLGPGILHKIIYNNTTGTSITIIDNVTGSTPVIGVITTATAALGSWDYSLPFNTGLMLTTVGDNLDATIVYE